MAPATTAVGHQHDLACTDARMDSESGSMHNIECSTGEILCTLREGYKQGIEQLKRINLSTGTIAAAVGYKHESVLLQTDPVIAAWGHDTRVTLPS